MEAKLREGTTLIVDRYSYSGVAFTAAKGLPFDWCKVSRLALIEKSIARLFALCFVAGFTDC